MIEQILKRFISEDAKLVVAALEKSIAVPQCKYSYHRYLDDMYSAAREHLGWIDATVIRKVKDRLVKTRRKEEALCSVRDVSAKILMGETFEDPQDVQKASSSGAAGLAQVQVTYAQAQAQAMHGQGMLGNPYGYSDLMRGRGGPGPFLTTTTTKTI